MTRKFEPMDMAEQVKYIADVEMLLHFLKEDLDIFFKRSIKTFPDNESWELAARSVAMKEAMRHIDNFEAEHPKHIEIPMGASAEHESAEHTDDFDDNPLTIF